MFKFFKEKIKESLSSLTKKVDEEGETVEEAKAPEETDKKEEAEKEQEEEKTEEPEPEAPAEEETPEEEVKETPQEETPSTHPEDKEETGSEKEREESVPETDETHTVGLPAQEKEEEKKQEDTKEKEERPAEPEDKPPEPSEEEPEEPKKKGFFARLTESVSSKRLTQKKFDDLFWDLELAMLENNVAIEVIEKIKEDLSEQIVDKPIPRNKIQSTIMDTLRRSIEELFETPSYDLMEKIEEKKPYVICFVGVNGSGKTTTIAKMAHMFKESGKEPVLAAADTFRAAAIDQLTHHAENIGVKIIKHDYGNDAAAVAFDAIEHAKAKKKDVVLIDTAGRMHSNKNLLDELKKVVKVSEPDLKLFIGESITGNDCVEQAKEFNEAVGIDGIILSKADIDEKGGAAISVSYVTKKPILYLGTGQDYADIEKFSRERILQQIELS